MNNIIFNEELNAKILSAFEKLYKAVSCTLGPKGKNVIISTDDAKPYITNDGVTIASAIKLSDEIENIIVEIIKEAAIKTNDNAGDGTTTSIILSYELYKEALKYINSGINKTDVIKEIRAAKQKILKSINNKTIKKLTNDNIYKVAKISSGDDEVAKLISKAYEIDEGINIIIKEEIESETKLDIIYGMKINAGFDNYSFIEDNVSTIEINDPVIQIENEIYDLSQISERANIIICSDYEEGVLTNLKKYNADTSNKIYIIKIPYYGEVKEEILKDIQYFINYKKINKVVIKKDQTLLLTSNEKSDQIEKRIEYLQERLKDEKFEYEKDILKTRIAGLKGLIATISLGAPTQIEFIERKMKIEDALRSVSTSLEHGIALGGGLTFYNISKELKSTIVGEKIFKNVLIKPIQTIVTNAGKNFKEIESEITNNFGYNAQTESIEDLLESGIFDSAKTLTEEIINSVSITTMLLTTDALVINRITNPKINMDNVL